MHASLSARRAWIEIIDYIIDYATDASLSARRAWIEIYAFMVVALLAVGVALRKESVDRNPAEYSSFLCCPALASLSARRAWIEILAAAQLAVLLVVALRKESVDRNTKQSLHCSRR